MRKIEELEAIIKAYKEAKQEVENFVVDYMIENDGDENLYEELEATLKEVEEGNELINMMDW